MWDIESYRDFLNDHMSKHHTAGSALIVLIVVGALVVILG